MNTSATPYYIQKAPAQGLFFGEEMQDGAGSQHLQL